MTLKGRLYLTGALIVLGAGWGATIPLSKLAVSTGYGHFGLIFWQLFIGAALLGCISVLRQRRLPLGWNCFKTYLIIALIGTVIPNSASFQAISHLPAGVMAILLSLIPMMAFPIALALGVDRFDWRRLLGLFVGLVGVALLVLPEV